MKYIKLFFYYLTWHYTFALKDLFNLWKTLLWCSLNYFSVRILLKTIYKPFFHLKETSNVLKKVDEPLIVTLAAGIFGFVVRLVTIICGVMSWFLVLVLGAVAFLVWLALPAILIMLFVSGLAAVFQRPLNIQL